MPRRPFDPLRYLKELRLDVQLGKDSRIQLLGVNALPPQRRQKAFKVIEVYEKLLRMQLDSPTPEMRPSINKLLAQGKIVIKDGKYFLP